MTKAPPVDERASCAQIDAAMIQFLKELQAEGYVKESLRNKRTVVRTFADWLRRRHMALDSIDESHIAAFLKRPPGRLPRRLKYKHAALFGFLRYLRRVGITRAPDSRSVVPGDDLVREYREYLRRDCGLAENTLLVYVRSVREWVRGQVAQTGRVLPDTFDAPMIECFLLDNTRHRSREYVRLLATALRSFLRFLFLRGHRSTDLSPAVPTVCRTRNARMPVFLSPEQVDQVLAATDRSTTVGRRDYAILLLLARLGLRAGEVARLELADVHWRTGELVIRGKGGVVEHLPLLADVGKALASYLRMDHRTNTSRRVFVCAFPPHGGFSGPSVVGDVVQRRLADAKISLPDRGAAHLFRHTLATCLIRQGASLAEIAQVLRHRSQTTTALYTHLSFEALRTVARPWPTTGGDQ